MISHKETNRKCPRNRRKEKRHLHRHFAVSLLSMEVPSTGPHSLRSEYNTDSENTPEFDTVNSFRYSVQGRK